IIYCYFCVFFFFQAEDGIRDGHVTGVQTCALPILLIGPVSYLLLGKKKQPGFDKIDLIKKLVPVYVEVLKRLAGYGAIWVQIDRSEERRVGKECRRGSGREECREREKEGGGEGRSE